MKRLILSIVVVTAIGCGADSTPDKVADNGDATGTTGTTGTTDTEGGTGITGTADTATTGDGTTGTDTSDVEFEIPADTLRTSYVSINAYSANNIGTGVAVAGFYDQSPSPLSVTTQTIGPCEVRTVHFGTGGGGGFPKYSSAGTLTIAGGAEEVKLTHGPGGYAAWQNSDVALFEGGETMTISASGAKIPPFDVSITTPAHLTMTSPIYPVGSPLDIDPTADMVFQWTGDSAGDVEIRIAGPQQLPEPQTTMQCRFPASAGTGTVPAAVLAAVSLSGTGTIAADVLTTSNTVAAGWGPISIRASMPALKSNGVQYATSVNWP